MVQIDSGTSNPLCLTLLRRTPKSVPFVVLIIKSHLIVKFPLLNAFKKKGDTQKAINTQDDELPSGQAWKVKLYLDNKYHPKGIHTELELENKLNGVSMKPRDNPDELFE
jgi:hypothetical protein